MLPIDEIIPDITLYSGGKSSPIQTHCSGPTPEKVFFSDLNVLNNCEALKMLKNKYEILRKQAQSPNKLGTISILSKIP